MSSTTNQIPSTHHFVAAKHSIDNHATGWYQEYLAIHDSESAVQTTA